MFVITLLFLASMLGQNSYCREDNNFKIIALASAIVLISGIAPEGVCSLFCFAMVVAIAIVDFINDEFSIEDRLIYQVCEKFFGKPLPSELSKPYGGGFSELCLRVELRNASRRRSASTKYWCRIAMIFLGLSALIVSLVKTFIFFGWMSAILLPVITFVMLVIMGIVYLKLYQ